MKELHNLNKNINIYCFDCILKNYAQCVDCILLKNEFYKLKDNLIFLERKNKKCLFCEKPTRYISISDFECTHCKIYFVVSRKYLYIRFMNKNIN